MNFFEYQIRKDLYYIKQEINKMFSSACPSPFTIIVAKQNIADVPIVMNYDLGTLDYTFQKSDILDNIDDSICRAHCSLTQLSASNQPTFCASVPGSCNCQSDLVYFGCYGALTIYGYDVREDTLGSYTYNDFQLATTHGSWDTHCQKTNTDLNVYADTTEITNGGATFTVHIDTTKVYSNEFEFYCFQGTRAGGNHKRKYTNHFKINVVCGSILNIEVKSSLSQVTKVNGNLQNCFQRILPTDVVARDPACAIQGLTAYHSMSDTSPNPAVQVSPHTIPEASDNFWLYSGDWIFDGLSAYGHYPKRDHWRDIYYYIQVQQFDGALGWLQVQGDTGPTQFNLFCHPCKDSTITATTINDLVVDKYSDSGIPNLYQIPDFYTFSDSNFTPLHASIQGVDCDAMYFYPFNDLAMTIPWTDPDIQLSAADTVGIGTNITPVQTALTNQTLTIKSDVSFKKVIFIKGLNTGKNFAAAELTVIVCGIEQVTHNGVDLVKIDFQKYQAYGYSSSPVPYFANQQNNDLNYFRDGFELSADPWFKLSDTTFIDTNSHADCILGKTYSLCKTISGNYCGQPWNSPEQLSKVQMVGNDLRINLVPFEQEELYLLIHYPKGSISAFRKLILAVCGVEYVRGNNRSQFQEKVKDYMVLSKLTYQYEIETSLTGSNNNTIVIDSSDLPETSLGEKFTNLFFYSTNPTHCPVVDCNINTNLNITEKGKVESLSSNSRPGQLQVEYYPVPEGAGFRLHLNTSTHFSWETFWVRCFTQSTWNLFDHNVYLQVDLQVVDCKRESVRVLKKNDHLNFTVFQNDTTPTNITISDKFESSNDFLCPILYYNVTKIVDVKTNIEVSRSWYEKILIGNAEDENEILSWKNLVLLDSSQPLDFEIQISAYTGHISSNTTDKIVHLLIEEPPNIAPIFFEEPSPVIVIDLNNVGASKTFEYQMPEIYDENQWDEAQVVIFTSSSLQDLISFDMETYRLKFVGLSEDLMGEHDLDIFISDQKEATSAYELSIEIVKPELFQGVIIDEIEEVEEVKANQTLFVESKEPVFARIRKIDQVGNMSIKFTQPMDTSADLDVIEKSIEIYLSPHYLDDDFDDSLLDFDWNIVSFEDNFLNVKLRFKHPLYVSQYLVQDQIIVKFINQTNFKTEDFNFLDKSSTTLVSYIPKQMFDTTATQNYTIAAEQLDFFLNFMFWIMLIFNVMFNGTESMDHYVLMINSLQIAMHVPLFSTALPGNVILFLEKTIPVVMFDIIKEDWVINPTNHFLFDEIHNQLRTDDPRFPAQIADIGYDTHNFLNNVGSVYIFFCIYILRVMFVGLLKVWTSKCNSGHKLYEDQKAQVFFKNLIILFVEGYLEFCLAGYLQWTNLEVDKNKYYGERLSSEVGNLSIFIACVFIPGIFIYMLTRPIEVLRQEQFQLKYGELYAGLKIDSKWTVSYYFVFIIRRISFLWLAFYAYSKPAQQIQALCLQNLMFSVYLGIANPRINKLLHLQELCNEFMIQFCSSLLCLFVGNFISDQDFKYLFGFILVIVLTILVLSNLMLVFSIAARLVRMIVMKYWHRLGRFLDKNYLKPIPRPPKPPKAPKPEKPKEDDGLLTQLNDLVGEEVKNEFTLDQKDEMIRQQVIKEFCQHYKIKCDEGSFIKVQQDFSRDVNKLVKVKKKEVANDILTKKYQLEMLMRKDLEKWTLQDTLFWLEYGLKLTKYSQNFKSLPLTGYMMKNKSEDQLRTDLNIRNKNDWQKIIESINQIRENQQNNLVTSQDYHDTEFVANQTSKTQDKEQFEQERGQIYNSIDKKKKSKALLAFYEQDLTVINEDENESFYNLQSQRRSDSLEKQKQMINLLKIQTQTNKYKSAQNALKIIQKRKTNFKF